MLDWAAPRYARRVEVRGAGEITGIIDPNLLCAKPVVTLDMFDNLTGRSQAAYVVGPEL